MRKEMKDVCRRLRKQGCEVILTRGGHLKVFRDGRVVTSMSGTPSDYRSLRNKRAELRRAGLTI